MYAREESPRTRHPEPRHPRFDHGEDVCLPNRHTLLKELLREGAQVSDLNPSACTKPVCIIPSCGGSERANSLISGLLSLSRQVYAHDEQALAKVFIADNGLSNSQRQLISEVGRDRQLSICIVDALPSRDEEKSAAYARNRAVSRLVAEAAFNEGLRGDVLFFDDDVAFQTPYSLATLCTQMMHPTAGYFPKPLALGIPTDEVKSLTTDILNTAWQASALNSSHESPVAVAYPSIWDGDGCADFSSMIAFGRESAAKTNALLLRRSALEALLSRVSDPFIIMPNGSFEDMWLNLAISRLGVLAKADGVRVLDQVRTKEQELCIQQAKWARDHSIAAADLRSLGLMASGLTVLEPHSESYREWRLAPVETPAGVLAHGVLVNPSSLLDSIRFLEKWRTTSPICKLIGADVDEERFPFALDELKFVVHTVLATSLEKSRSYEYRDGTFPTRRHSFDTDDLPFIRFRPRVRAARLAGNIAGLLDVEASYKAPIAQRVFIGGTREPVWPLGTVHQ